MTGTFKLACPVVVCPTVTIKPKGGLKLIVVTSSKIFEVGDWDLKSLARIVGALSKVAPKATLKKAEKSVMTPSLGTTEAKFATVPAAPVKSMVFPEKRTLAMEDPN